MGILGDILMSLLGSAQSYAEKNYDKMECLKPKEDSEKEYERIEKKEEEIRAKLKNSRKAIDKVNNEYRNR